MLTVTSEAAIWEQVRAQSTLSAQFLALWQSINNY